MKEDSSYKLKRALFAFLLIVILQYFFKDILAEISNSFVPYLQSCTNLLYFASYGAFFGNMEAKWFVIAATFAISNTYNLLIMTFIPATSQLITFIEKLIYLEPRPFMYSSYVIPESCEVSYGFPSNHSFGAAIIWFYFLKIVEETYFKGHKVIIAILDSFLVLAIILTFIVRLAQGWHSLDQLIFGLLQACLFIKVVYYDLEFRPYNAEWFLNFYRETAKYNLGLWLFFLLSILTVVLTPATFEPSWIQEIFEKCQMIIVETPFEKCLMGMGYWFALIGCYYGVLERAKNVENLSELEKIECPLYEDQNNEGENKNLNRNFWWKVVLRFLLAYAEIKLVLFVQHKLLRISNTMINRFAFKYSFGLFIISFGAIRYLSAQAKVLGI